jgi:nitrile hydratase
MPHDDHSHSLLPSDPALRVKALETLLVEKGLVDPAALDEIIDTYSHKIGPQNGAKVVAKAWVDPDFRAALVRRCNIGCARSWAIMDARANIWFAVENTGNHT